MRRTEGKGGKGRRCLEFVVCAVHGGLRVFQTGGRGLELQYGLRKRRRRGMKSAGSEYFVQQRGLPCIVEAKEQDFCEFLTSHE